MNDTTATSLENQIIDLCHLAANAASHAQALKHGGSSLYLLDTVLEKIQGTAATARAHTAAQLRTIENERINDHDTAGTLLLG